MSTPAPAGVGPVETPIFFPGSGGETLFGIITDPISDPAGITVIQLTAGQLTPSPDRNGTAVRMAARLAADGYHVVRFDYHGCGESTGIARTTSLSEPYVDDVLTVIDRLRADGHRTFVLVGMCFGGRSALAAAPRLEGLRALILGSPPVRDYDRGERAVTTMASRDGLAATIRGRVRPSSVLDLFRAERRSIYVRFLRAYVRSRVRRIGGSDDRTPWVSRGFLDPLEEMVARRIPVHMVYGTPDEHRQEFEEAKHGRLGAILQRAGALVDVTSMDGRIHGYVEAAPQDAYIGFVAETLRGLRRSGEPGTAA